MYVCIYRRSACTSVQGQRRKVRLHFVQMTPRIQSFGKAVRRAMRTHQANVFEHYLQAQQIGSRRAMPVTYGVQERFYVKPRMQVYSS